MSIFAVARHPLKLAPPALAVLLATAISALAANPPGQPKSGPGGSDYSSAEIVKTAFGEGSAQAFVFRPAGRAAQPRPVVIFMHLPGAISPKYYGAWINHLVRKGMIVVYPRYEEDNGRTRFSLMTGEAVKGIQAAFAGLAADEDARPDLAKIAVVGHSGGAILAANVAAAAAASGLPKPRLVFGAMPMRSSADKRGVALEDLSTLDRQTVVVMLVGDRDALAGEGGGREIIRAAKALPAERRLIVKAGSDNHGQPPLSASHFVPMALDETYDLPAIQGALDPPRAAGAAASPKDKAAREQARKDFAEAWRTGYEENRLKPNYEFMTGPDTMDWLAVWRPFDIARDIVFGGGDGKTIARDTRLYDMGLWSDGWPVKRLNAESPKPEPQQGGPSAQTGGQGEVPKTPQRPKRQL